MKRILIALLVLSFCWATLALLTKRRPLPPSGSSAAYRKALTARPSDPDEKSIRALVVHLLTLDRNRYEDPALVKLRSIGEQAIPALVDALKDRRFLVKKMGFDWEHALH